MSVRTLVLRLRGRIGLVKGADVAAALKLNPGQLSRILNGRIDGKDGGITLRTLVNFRDATGIPIAQLFEWWEEPDDVILNTRAPNPSADQSRDLEHAFYPQIKNRV